MKQMLKVEPFRALIDITQKDAPTSFRDVEVIGVVDGEGGSSPRWLVIETHDGWQFPRIADAIKMAGRDTVGMVEE